MNRNFEVITFISEYLYFQKASSSQFEIATMFITTTFKDSKKLKELKIMY